MNGGGAGAGIVLQVVGSTSDGNGYVAADQNGNQFILPRQAFGGGVGTQTQPPVTRHQEPSQYDAAAIASANSNGTVVDDQRALRARWFGESKSTDISPIVEHVSTDVISFLPVTLQDLIDMDEDENEGSKKANGEYAIRTFKARMASKEGDKYKIEALSTEDLCFLWHYGLNLDAIHMIGNKSVAEQLLKDVLLIFVDAFSEPGEAAKVKNKNKKPLTEIINDYHENVEGALIA